MVYFINDAGRKDETSSQKRLLLSMKTQQKEGHKNWIRINVLRDDAFDDHNEHHIFASIFHLLKEPLEPISSTRNNYNISGDFKSFQMKTSLFQ